MELLQASKSLWSSKNFHKLFTEPLETSGRLVCKTRRYPAEQERALGGLIK
jgi:hypothetical protein